jgi:hypothetical protein
MYMRIQSDIQRLRPRVDFYRDKIGLWWWCRMRSASDVTLSREGFSVLSLCQTDERRDRRRRSVQKQNSIFSNG